MEQQYGFADVVFTVKPPPTLRTTLYIAITPGMEIVVLVGDIDRINEIIEAASASLRRNTALRFDGN